MSPPVCSPALDRAPAPVCSRCLLRSCSSPQAAPAYLERRLGFCTIHVRDSPSRSMQLHAGELIVTRYRQPSCADAAPQHRDAGAGRSPHASEPVCSQPERRAGPTPRPGHGAHRTPQRLSHTQAPPEMREAWSPPTPTQPISGNHAPHTKKRESPPPPPTPQGKQQRRKLPHTRYWPAVTYSPTPSQVQYHRRRWA